MNFIPNETTEAVAETRLLDTLLLNPVSRNYDGSISDSPQLGLLYIATCLKDSGRNVKIETGDALYNAIRDYLSAETMGPRILGFYVNTDNIFEVHRLLSWAKKLSPETLTILGGPIASVEYRNLIYKTSIDFVAVGDGEFLMVELADLLESGCEDFSSVNGLVWKAPNGEMRVNPARATFRELDDIPIPNRDLYPIKNFALKSQIVTSRGCGFRCTFCFESTNRKYRAHSAQRVIDEIKYLRDAYGTRYITLVDDIFTTNHKRVREICELFVKEFSPHKDFTFYCEARVDTLAKFPDLIPMMQEAGLVRIQIGTESGDQKIVDAYKKQINLNDAIIAVQQCNDANVLSVFTNFIIGGAFETADSIQATQEFALELIRTAPGRFECNHTYLSPYPGTDIALRPEAYDIEILDKEFVTGVSDDHIFVETKELSKKNILAAGTTFNAAIAQQMKELIPSLPLSLSLHHLEMRNHGLLTRWSDYFATDGILTCLSRLTGSNNYSGPKQLSGGADLSRLVPQRTFSLRGVTSGKFYWPLRKRQFDMGPFEEWVLEHCSGKLTILEIAQRAVNTFNYDAPVAEVADGVYSFIEDLSQEGLIVFRSLPVIT